VMDLMEAHWSSLIDDTNGCQVFNVGTGQGVSVKEMVKSFEKANNINIPYQIQSRRAGDITTCYAAVDKIKNHFNWSAQLNLDQMCRDAWKVHVS